MLVIFSALCLAWFALPLVANDFKKWYAFHFDSLTVWNVIVLRFTFLIGCGVCEPDGVFRLRKVMITGFVGSWAWWHSYLTIVASTTALFCLQLCMEFRTLSYQLIFRVTSSYLILASTLSVRRYCFWVCRCSLRPSDNFYLLRDDSLVRQLPTFENLPIHMSYHWH